jgi:beta-lactamase superfamily II metal-dependent hydrolase
VDAPSLSDPRHMPTITRSAETIWAVGGLGDGGVSPTVSRLHVGPDGSLSDDAWHDVTPMALARFRPFVAEADGKLYVGGGSNSERGGEFACYDIASDSWTNLAPLQVGVTPCSLSFSDGRGGIHVVQDPRVGQARYDIARDEWTTLPPPPAFMAFADSCRVAGMVYVLGQGSAVYAYELATDRWQEVPANPLTGGGPMVCAAAGQFVLALGYSDSIGTCYAFDTIARTWAATNASLPPPLPLPWQSGIGIGATSFSEGAATGMYLVTVNPTQTTARLLRFTTSAPSQTTSERLLAQSVGYFPFDGAYTDYTTPSLGPATENGLNFVPRWDGRDAVHFPVGQAHQLQLPAFGVRGIAPWSGFTASCWFRVDAPFADGQVVGLLDDQKSLTVSVTPTALGITRYGGSVHDVTVPGGIAADHWYHLACVVDVTGSTVTAYLDGVPLETWPEPAGGPVDPFVDASVTGSSAAFDLANFAVFKEALAPTDVLYLACDGFHPEGTFSSPVEYLSYVGADTPVTCVDGPQLDPANQPAGLTVTAWVSAVGIDLAEGSAGTIFSRGESFDIGMDAEGYACASVWSGGNCTTLTSEKPLGTMPWSFIGLSLGAAEITLFVDNFTVSAPAPPSYPAVPDAPVTIGAGWPTPIYGVGVFDTAFSVKDFMTRMAELIEPHTDAQLVVYYDFSVNPPLARSPISALAVPPEIPAGGGYAQFARGVSLALDGCVDGGVGGDTILAPGAPLPVLTLSGWVRQLERNGTQTLAGRLSRAGGYVLAVSDGHLEASLVAAGAVVATARSPVPLPADQFSQVGVRFEVSASPGAYLIQLVLNGREVAAVDVPVSAAPASFGDPATPFAIGAQSAAPTASSAFTGFVQQMTAYDATIDPYDLYFGRVPHASTRIADWVFDAEAAFDATGTHPPVLLNGASVQPLRSEDRVPTPTLSPEQRSRRLEEALALDTTPVDVPEEHSDILDPPPSGGRQLTCHVRDGVTYVVAHGYGGEQMRAECVYAGGLDPVAARWIGAVVSVFGALALTVYSAEIKTQPAFEVVQTAWESLSAFREAAYQLPGVAEAAIPGLVFNLFRSLYDAGLLGKLLGCFGFSYFSVVRVAGSMAPYVGPAMMIAAIAIAAKKIYLAIQTLKPQLKVKPSNISAAPSSPIVTLNGDRIGIHVWLDGPPTAPAATVTPVPDPPLQVIEPPTLVFTAANFAVPQTVYVAAKAPDVGSSDPQPVSVVFTSSAAATGRCDVDLVVADLACTPEQVELTPDDSGANYVGEFRASLTAPIEADSPLTVSFEIDDAPGPDAGFTFEPTTVPLSDDGALLSDRSRRVKVSLKANRRKKTGDYKLALSATAKKPGTAGDMRRVSARLKARAAEEIVLTMVDAGKGNCFILTNTSNANPPKTRCAVIDGGVKGTYANMLPYLPAAPVPIDVYCSHYDDDHIAGLLELVPSRMAQIAQVVFNPPPPHASRLVEALLDAGADVDPHIIQNIKQGDALAQASAGKLRFVQGVVPPPSRELSGIGFPTLSVRWAGPRPDVWEKLMDDVAKPKPHKPSAEAVNRASLIFSINSKQSTFGFLQTGDGYDIASKPDVRGAMTVARQPILDFLQVPHHGSNYNSDRYFYHAFPARNYLISTDYGRHKHPDVETIQQIVDGRPPTVEPFNIYINAEVLPPTYPFPRGNYKAFIRAPGRTGVTFTCAASGVVVTPDDVVQRHWPLAPDGS